MNIIDSKQLGALLHTVAEGAAGQHEVSVLPWASKAYFCTTSLPDATVDDKRPQLHCMPVPALACGSNVPGMHHNREASLPACSPDRCENR